MSRGVEEIKRYLPHRFPILLVDRVLEVVPGKRIVATKAVSGNEPCYARTPDPGAATDYSYPSSLLIESWGQAGSLLAVWQRPNPDVLTGDVELAGSARDIELLEPVCPGSVLVHSVRVVRAVGATTILAGATTVDAKPVMTVGQFVVTLRPAHELRAGGTPAART